MSSAREANLLVGAQLRSAITAGGPQQVWQSRKGTHHLVLVPRVSLQ